MIARTLHALLGPSRIRPPENPDARGKARMVEAEAIRAQRQLAVASARLAATVTSQAPLTLLDDFEALDAMLERRRHR